MYSLIIEELDLAIGNVLRPLRSGEGFEKAKVEDPYAVLENCAEVWADSDTIPKLAASLLVNLSVTIEDCAYPYPRDEAEKIRKASYKVRELISKVVPWRGPPI